MKPIDINIIYCYDLKMKNILKNIDIKIREDCMNKVQSTKTTLLYKFLMDEYK